MQMSQPEHKEDSSYIKGRKEFLYGVKSIEKLVKEEELNYLHQGAIKRWLLLLQTAKQSIPNIAGENVVGSDVGHFISKRFDGEEKYMIQSFVNTLCTFTPTEWLEEIGQDFGMNIYRTEYPMLETYSQMEIPYTTAQQEEREYTLEFVEEIVEQV